MKICQFQPRSERGNNSTVQPSSARAHRCQSPDCLAVCSLSGFDQRYFLHFTWFLDLKYFLKSWTWPWRSWRRRGMVWCSSTTCPTPSTATLTMSSVRRCSLCWKVKNTPKTRLNFFELKKKSYKYNSSGCYPARLKKVLIVTAPLWFKAPFKVTI